MNTTANRLQASSVVAGCGENSASESAKSGSWTWKEAQARPSSVHVAAAPLETQGTGSWYRTGAAGLGWAGPGLQPALLFFLSAFFAT